MKLEYQCILEDDKMRYQGVTVNAKGKIVSLDNKFNGKEVTVNFASLRFPAESTIIQRIFELLAKRGYQRLEQLSLSELMLALQFVEESIQPDLPEFVTVLGKATVDIFPIQSSTEKLNISRRPHEPLFETKIYFGPRFSNPMRQQFMEEYLKLASQTDRVSVTPSTSCELTNHAQAKTVVNSKAPDF